MNMCRYLGRGDLPQQILTHPPRTRSRRSRSDGAGSLTRIEAQAALGALIPHLGTARLGADPSPFRQNAVLRGPRHLPVQL